MYRAMRMARTFEQKLSALYRQGKIVGAVYLGMGQEAIATGVVSLLQPDDYFSTVARGLAGWFMRGVEPRHVLARWLGKDIPPVARPRARPVSRRSEAATASRRITTDRWRRGFPSGAGFALAFKYRREPRVYVALTGDGATSPGDFYEGLNFAAIHKLPLVVMVENNCFAYSTPQSCRCRWPTSPIARRRSTFPATIGFGNDIFEVRRLARQAIDHARSGARPVPGRVQDLPSARPRRARRHGVRAAPICASSGSAAIRCGCCRSICVGDGGVPGGGRRGDRRRVPARRRATRSTRPRPCPMPDPSTVHAQAVRRMSVRRTYLEAISEALREEMRRDPERDPARRGHRHVRRRLQDHARLRRGVRRRARHRHADFSESGFVGAACGAAIEGLRPVVEFQFADFIACAFDQIVNYAAKALLPLGHAGAGRLPRAVRRRLPRRPVPLAESGSVVHARAGPEGRAAVDAVRREGPAQGGDSRQQPGHLFRAQASLPAHPRGRAGRRLHRPARRRRHQARGPRPDDRHLRRDGARVPGGGRSARPTKARSAR